MIFIYLLLIAINIILSSLDSEAIIKAQDVEKLEKQAKALACSILINNSLNLKTNKEKQIKEILKKNKIIKKESETMDKMQDFLQTVCYLKIDAETANQILIIISEGKEDLSENNKYNNLFDFNPKGDYKNFKKYMDDVNIVMKEIEKEEKSLHEKRKVDPDLDKELKDLGRKLERNKRYEENNIEKNEEKDENMDNSKKKKNKKKEKKEKQKKGKKEKIENEKNKENIEKFEEKKPESDPSPPEKKRKFSFKSFFEKLDLTTIWGFIISLIIILIFPCIFIQNNMYKENIVNKEEKNEEEKKENNKGNEINKNDESKESPKSGDDMNNLQKDNKKEKID